MKYKIVLIPCLFWCLIRTNAQNGDKQFRFDHLTIEDGLSQSAVFAIAKDHDGFMWFGTRDGLNRYDSRTFKIYRNDSDDPKSLIGNSVNCFLMDQNHNLWIGTNDGISIYDPVHDSFINSPFNSFSKQKLADNHILTLMQGSDGAIWVGTQAGLSRLRYETLDNVSIENYQNDQADPASIISDEIRASLIDRSGAMWVASASGLSRVMVTDDRVSFVNYPLPLASIHSKSWINCLVEYSDDQILVGTEQNGLKLFDKTTGVVRDLKPFPETARPIQSIRVIKSLGSKFWLGTIDGLFIFDRKTNDIQAYHNNPDDNLTISDNSIRSMYMDESGTLWLGTFYGGVNVYSPLARQFDQVRLTNKRNQKAYKIAGAIVSDTKGSLWVSTDGHGLYNLDRDGNIIKHIKHSPTDATSLSHNKIKCLQPDESGMWIGTIMGLNFYDFATEKITHYNPDPADPSSLPDDRIYHLRKDTQGDLWIGTYRGGLSRYDKATKEFVRYVHSENDPQSISSNGITYILEDSRKNIWVGTTSGLNKKPFGQNTFQQFKNPDQGNSGGRDYILCLYEDRSGNIWVGTRERGLRMLRGGQGNFVTYSSLEGLPSNSISGILEDSRGNLWLSTENGLSKLNPKSGSIKNYNNSDGLVCKEFNFNSFHKDQDGFMYFGGYNGIVKFHPDSIRENETPPTLQFTRLRLFNGEVGISQGKNSLLKQNLGTTRELTFNHKQNIFSIEFAALSFVNPSKNRYAYKLDGFENEWNYVDDPVATYMNLGAGSYTLLVKASNNDGVWTGESISLKIEILPPPWKTWWAYSIYGLAVVGLLLALIRFNRMRWKLEHDLKIEHMEKEQQQKLHKAKLNFFTNIAHEIRTPLTLIMSPVEMVADKYQSDSFIRKQLDTVKSNTGRLMKLINQLLDFQTQESGNLKLKLRKGDLVELLKEIAYSFSEFAKSRHVELRVTSAVHELFVNYDRDEMEKVFYNLLHNAFKFTPSGGVISVSISEAHSNGNDPVARIIIEDNGIGIPAEDLPKIFNRFFQVENNVNESGFGIGLSLTKGIVDLHLGTIQVESHEAEIGQHGFTRFTITLPLYRPEIAATPIEAFIEKHTVPVPESGGDGSSLESASEGQSLILIVEDNLEIRECLCTILSPHYKIIEASHGEEAWRLATTHLPNLVLSDIAMPHMDGIELTQLMKNDLRTSHIPIILLTARGAVEQHVEGISKGADDYITKPFHSEILKIKIENLLNTREMLRTKYQRVVILEPHHEVVEDPDSRFLHRLSELLDKHLCESEFNVSLLTEEIGMSRPVLFRKVKMLTGLSIIDLIKTTRLKKAASLLRQRKMTVSEVAYTVGFNDPKYFSKSFRAQFGKTPKEYLQG